MKIAGALDQLLRARTSAGRRRWFTTAHTDASQPVEHVLPEWVRRPSERAVAPAESARPLVEAVSEPIHADRSVFEGISRDETELRAVELQEPVPVEPLWETFEAAPVLAEIEPATAADVIAEDAPEPVEVEPFAVESVAVEEPGSLEPAGVVDDVFEDLWTPNEVDLPTAEPAAVEEIRAEKIGTKLVVTELGLSRLETAAGLAESMNLGFHLGLAVERIGAAAAQGSAGATALREAAWLIERHIALLERPIGAATPPMGAPSTVTGEMSPPAS